jgi:hypothetical protein
MVETSRTLTFVDRVSHEINWLQDPKNQELLQKKFNELKADSNQNKNQNFSVSIFLLLPDDKTLVFRKLAAESIVYLSSRLRDNNATGKKANELEKIMRQTVSDITKIESALSQLSIVEHSKSQKADSSSEQLPEQLLKLHQPIPQQKSVYLTDIKSILNGYHQQKGKFRQFFSRFHPWIAVAGRSYEIYLLEKALGRLSEDMQDWKPVLLQYVHKLKMRRDNNNNKSCFSCCGIFSRNNKKSKLTKTDLVLVNIIDDLSPIQSW